MKHSQRITFCLFLVFAILGCANEKFVDTDEMALKWYSDTYEFIEKHCSDGESRIATYTSEKESVRNKILDIAHSEYGFKNISMLIELDVLHQIGDPKLRIVDKNDNVYFYKYDESEKKIVYLYTGTNSGHINNKTKCSKSCFGECDRISIISISKKDKIQTVSVHYY